MSEGYLDFARFYDRLTENVDYNKIADCYCGILKRCGIKGGKLLDIACGTGSLSVIMSKRGYTVTGIDMSEDMLSVAASKSENVRWLRLNMTKLPFKNEFDAAICSLDGINHLEALSEIKTAFKNIYRSLKKGGVFAADFNTPYKHLNILSNNAFIFDYEDFFCSWQNELDQSSPLNRVDMFLSFFEKQKNKSYIRSDDSLSEIAPPPELIIKLFKASGFQIKKAAEFMSMKKIKKESEKYLVAAKKQLLKENGGKPLL